MSRNRPNWSALVAAGAAGAMGIALLAAPAVSGTAAAGAVTEYTGMTASSRPNAIAAGPDGNLWFTETTGLRIGRVSTSGAFTEFSDGIHATVQLQGMAAGPDGNMWFVEFQDQKIGKITTAGVVTEYPVPDKSRLRGIAAGPDGNMWFTVSGTDEIGRMTTDGTPNYFTTGAGSFPYGVAAGPDGNIWFTANLGNFIGRMDPTTGSYTPFSAGLTGTGPQGIVAGPDGNMWFIESGKIGRITMAGVITEFAPTPPATIRPAGIAAGPDGNIWFTETREGLVAQQVARITPGGVMTEFTNGISTGSGPTGIAPGPDGRMWFTEQSVDKIGAITTGWDATDIPLTATGSGQADSPLICGAGVFGPKWPVTIAWQAGGTTIPGATSLAWTPTQADVGSSITCTVLGRMDYPWLLTKMKATSNAVTVVAATSGPTGPTGPTGDMGSKGDAGLTGAAGSNGAPGAAGSAGPVGGAGQAGAAGPIGATGEAGFLAVFAPGIKSVRRGHTLKATYAVSAAGPLVMTLKGPKSTKVRNVVARTGNNKLKWKMPRSLKKGKYRLTMTRAGQTVTSTRIRIR